MTEKLYIQNPYMKEFKSIVKEIRGENIILEKTCFYPKSGGQIGDIGYLNQTRVINTIYDDSKEDILHIVEGDPHFIEGDLVVGKIDWDRRYKIMRLHSASHIMEHFLFKMFGNLKLVGSHVNERYDSSTYEYFGTLDIEKLKKVEDLTNEFILRGYEIQRWEDPNKKGWLYWKAGEIEISCSGTHPINTKEIGKVVLKRKSGGTGKEDILTKLAEINP